MEKLSVNWFNQYGNLPSWKITINSLPKNKVYQEYPIENGIMYVSSHFPFYHFLYEDPFNKNGFGGSEFTLDIKGGAVKIVKGPWSSRAECVNLIPEYECTDISISVGKSPNSFVGGYAIDSNYLQMLATQFGFSYFKEKNGIVHPSLVNNCVVKHLDSKLCKYNFQTRSWEEYNGEIAS